jgi:general L-amino acid transport system substrate-binding protein
MPEVNSSPRKLTAPPGLFETVSKLSVSTAAKCERPATGPPFWPGFIAHRLPRAPMTRKTG